MDQREDYWGDPNRRDPEDYSSGQPHEPIHLQQHQLAHPHFPQHSASPIHGQPQHLQHHHHHHPPYDRQQVHRPSRQNAAISEVDVLCGRGKTSFNHGTFPSFNCYTLTKNIPLVVQRPTHSIPNEFWTSLKLIEGNKTFRTAVSEALDDFVTAANRFEKSIIVQRVVDIVHARGGRFLKEDTRAGTWYQLSDQQSKEKVGHAIRDAANLYEVRKKKEEELLKLQDRTPQLKRTGSDDDNKASDWWKSYDAEENTETGSSRGDQSKSYRSSYTPTDFSVDYSNTSAAKRRGSAVLLQTTDYQPQKKRRRTTSPSQQSYFQATMALSAPVMSTPSPQYSDDPLLTRPPTRLRRSPIIHGVPTTASNVVSSEGSQKSLIGTGGIMTIASSTLKSSPIAPIVPPPASAQHRKSQQYYHRFTVYDPQEQQASGEKEIHREFHPETESNDTYTPPVEANRPTPPSSQYSGTSSYEYGRSDFVRSSIPQSSRFSYNERHYPPHYQYEQYHTMSTPILPPMGHFPPYPPPHYRHHPQGPQPPPTSYVPRTYYPPPQPQSRRASATPFDNSVTVDESTIFPDQPESAEAIYNNGNESNSDEAVA